VNIAGTTDTVSQFLLIAGESSSHQGQVSGDRQEEKTRTEDKGRKKKL
jgi:hypothetical protein